MTISYSRDVSTTQVALFLRLLFRWRGSIYRLMVLEMIVYLVIYYLLSILYTFVLQRHEGLKIGFHNVAIYCNKVTNDVPVTFIMGFFLSYVLYRWWAIFQAIPWPDRAAYRIQYVSVLVIVMFK
jgi:hypothetical protein